MMEWLSTDKDLKSLLNILTRDVQRFRFFTESPHDEAWWFITATLTEVLAQSEVRPTRQPYDRELGQRVRRLRRPYRQSTAAYRKEVQALFSSLGLNYAEPRPLIRDLKDRISKGSKTNTDA